MWMSRWRCTVPQTIAQATKESAHLHAVRNPILRAQDTCFTAHLLVVVTGHVLLHTLPHRLVLAGGAADHAAAHPTLQQRMQNLSALLLWAELTLGGSMSDPD